MGDKERKDHKNELVMNVKLAKEESKSNCRLSSPGTQAVYFVENPYESVVTHFSVGQNVIKVQRLFNMTDSEPIPQMTIQNILINAVYEFSDVIRFHIDGDGWINITHLNRAQARDITNVSLYVTSNDQHHEIVAYTIVNIRKVNVSGETRECPYQQPAYHQHLCFGDDDGNDKELVLTVEENQSGITLSRLRQGVFLRSICRKASVNYQIANGTNLRNGMHIADFFEVQQNTSFLYLKSPLNREDTAELHLTVLCTVHLPTQKVSKFKRNIRVIVGDVDDNPPLFQTLQHFQRTINPAETIKSLSAVVTDRDMATADEYEVTARNDPLGIVKNITKREFHHGQLVDQKPVANSPTATSIAAVIALNWSTSALANYTFYSVDILFKDKNYIRGIESNIEGTAIYTLHVKGHDLNIQKTISRNASKYAQIYKIPDKGGDHFYIDPRETTIFAVSWYTGIVYVDSELALRSTSHKVIKFKVKIMKGNVVQEKVHITVNIDDTPVNVTGECGYSCSFYKSKEECTSHCGLGTISGHCHVRKGLKHSPTALYGTCSPNLVHCPDGICDDVESNHPMLCPQDCTLKNVNGGSLNTKYKPPKGIKQAGGWCSCDTSGSCTCKTPPPPSPPSPPKKKPITEASMECNCDRDVKIYPRQSTFATPSLNDTNNKPINRDENFVPKNRNDDGCSGNCKTIVIAVVSGFLCFTYAIILIYCMWRCHRHRRHNNKTNKKYPPGSVSMSAVHSDYVEEQNRLVSQSNMADLAAPKSIDGHSEVLAGPWEIARTSILMEENNRDGKFGVLVRAKLCDGFNQNIQAPVTVKIARNGSSGNDRQYLWSEFILLRSLKHANIIRLIGVCSWRDPFLLVMEFCENGTLVNYLRNHRPDGAQIGDDPNNTGDESPPGLTVSITIRDLLSFSWQIAKGMEYLDDMKLVHGDLSARNILVSSGGVIKIFNLRPPDVLAAQLATITGKTYKSFASIKWMDPNIIWSQMITTKSDVWSFAVVLWEIVTFGDSPYPGISSDRILSLLKTGYRMDKPDNCPDEMYAIMQKCWKTEPEERPSFHDLANIFDKILQERTGYLDLESSRGKSNSVESAITTGVSEETGDMRPAAVVQNSLYFQQKTARLSAPEISEQPLLCRASLENGKVRHSMCHLQDLSFEEFQKDGDLFDHPPQCVYNIC
ncbi:proto-oncogene tyrosine-protein kinase receptor Ret-like [Octopus vulgaris]|uniref:Proto-oncogene tyrosine-protein kinase receptor Ret-like n=1 Tax=Octopus vulgaris TaxID=6645 RepID=A0AA36EZ14_OCTVU|nr:proto-oncogene tyrosine-protein kinase receptor Ret-like [Octopus vulgaris]